MKNLIKVFLISSLIAFSFLISSKQVYAATAKTTGCYCCGGSQSCAYTWKNAGDTLGGNCAPSPVSSKTKTNCNGTAGSGNSSAGACWYCEPVAQSKSYKWTTDGSNPNPHYCHVVNGRSQSSCKGVPTTDPGSGSDTGSDSGTDPENENSEYEENDGPDININTSDASCSGIIGSGQFKMRLTEILNAMRIIGVAMVIIFSTMDFGKALISQDNDGLKKSTQTAFKRLVIAIVIFFVPVILNILLSLAGIGNICI